MLAVANFCIHQGAYPQEGFIPFVELQVRAFLRKHPLVFLSEYECYRALVPLLGNNPKLAKNNVLFILNNTAECIRRDGIEALSLFRSYDIEVENALLELNVNNIVFLKEYMQKMAKMIQNDDNLKGKKIYSTLSLSNTERN